MKKLLALLFVCAGLTAMAAPHVNKADLSQANKGQMVMKANTMANQFTASVSQSFMQAAKKDVVKKHTNLVNKRAPRRLSAEEIINMPYVCFLYAYDIMGEEPVPADPFFAGSGAYWYPDASEGLYFAGLYWDEDGSTYYLPIDVDYTTGEVALSWGLLLQDTTLTGKGGRNRTDTVKYELLLSEAYWENEEQTDCKGTMYTDGSIIFDDNYVYYAFKVLQTYKNNVLNTSDTTVSVTMFVGTEILAANGVLNYTKEQTGAAAKSPVYMFQNEPGDTLYVGNMWNYGMPNAVMTISPDAKMNYNCIAEVDDEGIIYLENPIWDVDDSWISGGLGEFYAVGSYTDTIIDGQSYINEVFWGFDGDVTPQQISWDYTMPSNGNHFLYGYLNNVLTWTNGNTFRIPVAPGPDFIKGDVDDDEAVNISDVTALIDALLSGDYDSINADAADCDEDGSINISDVTALIDYLLAGHW